MAPRTLPLVPDPAHLRKQAKTRLTALKATKPQARLVEAQALLAHEYGFVDWIALLAEAERRANPVPREQRTALALRALARQRLSPPEDEAPSHIFFQVGIVAQITFILIALTAMGLVMDVSTARGQTVKPGLAAYAGAYQLGAHAVAWITLQDDHLSIRLTGQPSRDLAPGDNGGFSVQGAPVQITFLKDAAGAVTGLTIHQGGRDVNAAHISEAEAKAAESAPRGHPMARTWATMAVTPHLLPQQAGALDYWPCFSPDGQTLMFSRSLDGGKNWSLMRMATNDGAPQAIATPGLSATRADWSVQGRVAFTGTGTDGVNRVWIMGPDGANAHAVPGSEGLLYPSWYADGRTIAAMDGKNLLVRRLGEDGTAMTRLSDAAILTGMPSVSPRDGVIAVAAQANKGQLYNQEENVIWLLDGVKPHPLENPPLQGRAPVWSPDGGKLAFESDRGSSDGHYAVFMVNRDGSGLVQVTDYALNATHPVFSRDGKKLVMAVGDPARGLSSLAIVDLP